MRRSCFAAAVLVLGASSILRADDKAEKAKEEKARAQCASILQACEAFATNPANKAGYPTTLTELVKPPFGGASYLKNGEKDLLDPWGKMVRYAVAKDDKGRLRAYVWTERKIDGKTKVVGTKAPEPKKS
jgi:hypothetical protein